MITVHHRAATDLDLKTLTDGRKSLMRNVATASLPVAVFVFGVVYLLWRSSLAAGVAAVSLFAASVASNISFFRKVRRAQSWKEDSSAVEVYEVSAQRVLDI